MRYRRVCRGSHTSTHILHVSSVVNDEILGNDVHAVSAQHLEQYSRNTVTAVLEFYKITWRLTRWLIFNVNVINGRAAGGIIILLFTRLPAGNIRARISPRQTRLQDRYRIFFVGPRHTIDTLLNLSACNRFQINF